MTEQAHSLSDKLELHNKWEFERLFDAPHRLAFSAATLMLAITAVWWAAAVLVRVEGVSVHWALHPATAHGLVMTFGFIPLFFVGFLFTAGPKWLRRPPVQASNLGPPVLAMLCGWGVFLASTHGRDVDFGHTVGAFGMGAVTIGWFGIVRRFVDLVRRSTEVDQTHSRLVALGCCFGLGALVTTVYALFNGNEELVRAATRAALWGFVGHVFVVVAHRMIPFLSAAAPALDSWRPTWLLWVLVSLMAGKTALVLVDGGFWHAGAIAQHVVGTIELTAGLAVLVLSVRWGFVQSLSIRMLAMLNIGLGWLGVSLAVSGIGRLTPGAELEAGFALAALHALTLGFVGSTMFTMVTRLSCGHGGRSVAADTFIWRLFWVLQLAVLARLGSAALTSSAPAWAMTLLGSAATGWAGVCVSWAMRYGPWFGKPKQQKARS